MSEASESVETADRHARWVAMWQEGVGASPEALGVVDLSTHLILELSAQATELLGLTHEEARGLDYLSVVDRPDEASEKFRLFRDRVIDGARGRVRFRRRDGSLLELEYCKWAIRSYFGPDLVLLWTRTLPKPTTAAVSTGEVWVPRPAPQLGNGFEESRVTLDDRWRIADVHDTDALLGRNSSQLLGTSIIELTHPDDVAALLFAFARATTETSVGARVRLRHSDGSWRMSEVVPSIPEEDGVCHFSVLLAIDGVVPDFSSADARSRIEGEILRIASELRARIPIRSNQPSVTELPGLERLTPREKEILARLEEGERVPSIAAELYLSQSTVRHHLSSIFSKVGVHSQAELIHLLRAERSV